MSYQQERFIEIADKIREKTESTELIRPLDFASKIDDVYNAGVEAGKAQGGSDSHYDMFWDNFQNYGNRSDYRYAFAYSCWNDENYNPKYPIVVNGYAYGGDLFNSNANITDTKVPITLINTSTTNNSVFNGTTALVTIPKLILGGNARFNGWFTNAKSLVNITIEGSIDVTISFAWSPLSVESMKSIVSCLTNYSGTDKDMTNTLTFTEACWTALEADSSSPTGGTWKNYVSDLGWNV